MWKSEPQNHIVVQIKELALRKTSILNICTIPSKVSLSILLKVSPYINYTNFEGYISVVV